MADKRFDKIIFLMKKKFDQRKYYEGQQMLKTLYSRLMNQNKYEQASKLLSEGALILMGHKKVKEAIEIISDLIGVWSTHPSDKSFNKQRAKLLHELFCMISQDDTQNIHDFMQTVLEWIQKLKENAKQSSSQTMKMDEIDFNMMPIYKSYGINLWNLQKYYLASTAFVRQSDSNKMVDLFAEWSQKSSCKETPYFMARIVLQYLAVKNIDGCRAFINSVLQRDKTRGPSLQHPLENFCDLICESVERKSVVLYNVVVKTYMPLIKIESSLVRLLQSAGYRCLGIPMPKNSGGLMGNLLSLLS